MVHRGDGWSQNAILLQRGILRPKPRLFALENGRELLTCDSEADCDQNAVCWYLKRVEICHFVIGRHIATKKLLVHARKWS